MPTYSYRCTTCAHEFEQFQKFAEDALTDCPSCDGRIRRIIHPVGVVFKGSGWYITDSRKSNGSESESSDKSKRAEPASANTNNKDDKDNKKNGKASDTDSSKAPAAEPTKTAASA